MIIRDLRRFAPRAAFIAATFFVILSLALHVSSSHAAEKNKAGGSGGVLETLGMALVGSDDSGLRYHDKRANAEIIIPPRYHVVAAKQSTQVSYDFGIKHDSENFEVRVRYDTPDKVPAMVPETWALTMMLNINGGNGDEKELTAFAPFPPQAVREEFGADWGFSSMPFDTGKRDPAWAIYGACQLNQVYKNKAGVYTMFRCFDPPDNDPQKLMDLIMESFHVVRFK
ncbi:MAG: hypothetical protein HY884_01880 [Deltaproteobacteria bacterium]|nr:hypothetical protein [Deltaproteobacteria bacterium]